MKGIDVLEDVGLAVGDEDHIELVEGLVDKSNIVLLDSGMLCAAVGQLRERGKESLNSGTGHLTELPGEDSFPATGAYGSSKDDL